VRASRRMAASFLLEWYAGRQQKKGYDPLERGLSERVDSIGAGVEGGADAPIEFLKFCASLSGPIEEALRPLMPSSRLPRHFGSR